MEGFDGAKDADGNEVSPSKHGICVECGKQILDVDGCWQSGECCVFGTLGACSRTCAEAYANRPGHRRYEGDIDEESDRERSVGR